MTVNENEAPMIDIRNVSKWYGSFQVLKNCSTSVRKGEVVVVCGPSGSGKSTLIKTVNGLEPVQQGTILVNGVEVTNPKTNLTRLRSHVGMVFQHFELFPHLSIRENLVLAQMKVLKRNREEERSCSSRPSRSSEAGGKVSGTAFRRSAAACGNRPGARDGPDLHAVRRTDFGSRHGND